MVALVYGFPSKVAALRFEWAWQKPHLSRRLQTHEIPTGRSSHSAKFKLSILAKMLSTMPWKSMALTVSLLEQSFLSTFRGLKPKIPDHIQTEEEDLSTFEPDQLPDLVLRPEGFTVRLTPLSPDQLEDTACSCCEKPDDKQSHLMLQCLSEGCPFRAHTSCLAQSAYITHQDSCLVPAVFCCPVCKTNLHWQHLLLQLHFRRRGLQVELVPVQAAEVSIACTCP